MYLTATYVRLFKKQTGTDAKPMLPVLLGGDSSFLEGQLNKRDLGVRLDGD